MGVCTLVRQGAYKVFETAFEARSVQWIPISSGVRGSCFQMLI